MDKLIVIENATLDDARGVVAEVALECWEGVGWALVGPASHDPGSTLTADEWAEANTPQPGPRLPGKKQQSTQKEQE